VGTIGGYFAASELSALLQPAFGWRIMWFLNMPTGLILIAMSPLIPESARFLQHMGRLEESRAMLRRFGAISQEEWAPRAREREKSAIRATNVPSETASMLGTTAALTLAALSWGFVNFGVLLWLPSALVANGRSIGLASTIIAKSTLFAAPTVVIAAYLYSTWSTKRSLLAATAIMTLGLGALLLHELAIVPMLSNPIIPVALLIVGASGVISILLPYSTENFPIRMRGRSTGWVAGWSKIGGLVAQILSVLSLVPSLGTAIAAVIVPALASILLVVVFGPETRGRDLRELESHDD